jgi:NAD(P)-dependent dehydrogenase (short-subunit alcohol dehydrogenase family)
LTRTLAARRIGAVKGRICVVTGASAGIGKAAACELARRGATVVAIARDRGRGEAAVEDIRRESGGGDVHLMLCDLASQASVRKLADDYRARWDRLHVLVNNAGAILGEHRITEDGIESTFATNHLGPFLLTNLLLDVIRASTPARIVNVSSTVHKKPRSLDLDAIVKFERGYAPMDAYQISKLANVLFTVELARRLEGTGVTANSLHPGVVATNFGDSWTPLLSFLTKVARIFMIGPDKGAETTVHLAASPEVEGVSGKYFANKREARPSRLSADSDLVRRLWEKSEELTGLGASRAAAAE